MPFALFAANSGAAVAKADVSHDQITCDTVIATAQIKPPLSASGTASTPTQLSVKGTLGGCTDTTNGAVKIASGSFSGKLAGTGNTCTGLLGTSATSGTLTFKWKADKTTPILQTQTAVTVVSVTGGVHGESLNGGSQNYGDFKVNSSGSTGAFTGPSGTGAANSNESVTSEDVGNILNTCNTVGVKLIHIGLGEIKLG